MDQLERRLNHATETILNNEALTADLDDETAQVLLDWGLDLVRRIAHGTQGLDDAAAEEKMDTQLKAVRRAMRLINRGFSESPDMPAEAQATYLTQLIEQATIIYGDQFVPPAAERQAAWAAQPKTSLPQLIADLRQLLEPPSETALASQTDSESMPTQTDPPANPSSNDPTNLPAGSTGANDG